MYSTYAQYNDATRTTRTRARWKSLCMFVLKQRKSFLILLRRETGWSGQLFCHPLRSLFLSPLRKHRSDSGALIIRDDVFDKVVKRLNGGKWHGLLPVPPFLSLSGPLATCMYRLSRTEEINHNWLDIDAFTRQFLPRPNGSGFLLRDKKQGRADY